MSINFARTFGNSANRGNGGVSAQDRPKAQFWLNIGYSVELDTEEGVEKRFVSLPAGIPLDTQDHLPTNSRNAQFAAFQTARNDLLDQIMEECKHLEPGEEKILDGDFGGLQIQLRHVNAEAPAIERSENQFSRKLAFA